MRLKILAGIGVIFTIAVVVVAYGSISFDNKETTKKIQTRKSTFYRGIPLKPRHSESNVNLPKDSIVLEPVLQGDLIEHDFIIQNKSQEILKINNAKSCCGFILTSFTKEIPPGGAGVISVTAFTDKYGGKTIKGAINATSNDVNHSAIAIDASVFVKKIADISQHKLILKGPHKQKLEQTTTIIPEKECPFKIIGIRAKKGLHIAYDYKEVETQAGKGFLVTVSNTLKKEGSYRDMLFIQTDNPKRPELRIRVEGHITE